MTKRGATGGRTRVDERLRDYFGDPRWPARAAEIDLDAITSAPPRRPHRLPGPALRQAAALALVAALAFAVFGLPFVLSPGTPSSSRAPSASLSSESTPLEAPTDPATARATEPPPPTEPPEPDYTPQNPAAEITAPPTRGPTPAPVDNGWWQAIKLRWSQTAVSGGTGWVEVTTQGPTQCTLEVYYSSALQQAYGGFGAPSDKPRTRQISIPDTFTGTAYATVECWRDGWPNGPTHTWKLAIKVSAAAPTPATAPTPTPPPPPTAPPIPPPPATDITAPPADPSPAG